MPPYAELAIGLGERDVVRVVLVVQSLGDADTDTVFLTDVLTVQ